MSDRAGRRLLLLAALGLAACEPSGPGALTASVDAPRSTGALVIELTGAGITGFDGVGDARTFAGVVDPSVQTHRVVVVSASGARIRFRVEVRDVSDPPPTATVVSAVDLENEAIAALAGYSVRVAR